ncbi:MAG: prepilin-type N-terminal cleavage/methylation domain-containing protein [Patescibacteria group bacterium]|nr:prepilin-type N-terminal cleavage/methylation domain-containing protein [Patescibacteria group bacterium]MDD4610989.1 prepilin-type N-terminal cleavage/methylation domain-containing protein [Patescibacteria group bacterium]
MKKMTNKKGFTLIELLIVIAIIAIIAAVAFVALDPLTRFRDARDSRRWADISAIMTAIKVDQVDNKGHYVTAINNIPAASSTWVYMIGTDISGCEAYDAYCDTDVTTSTNCIDLAELVTDGYLGAVPVSPDGDGTWAASSTGYTLQKKSNGSLIIRSCESENADEIMVTR